MGAETGQRKISLGDTVKIKFENGEIKSYTVVSSDKTDPGNGFISDMCPIGRAVIGATAGEKKKYTIHGKETGLEIVEIFKK
ncbi:MAG: Transcription elongation factor GreA [Candidatus Jorgensenbacteria bacterium GW2011_GWA1_48_13]|uniref:Transcription elongation factor GreA n=2 Tax=Candidatus Joergenseniibacteriota TaxID=1752739 RepID=A0A0G1W993_9BACT|nr:MAG: Transcription elongation factor GreA [Candidatus Jorgensenbacteria bacterium GW2011_GWA1_48_13]KKU98814.1 MAG: Transcription elongation factor GreA [Candidatus Jorgensenbacteria bacterium GW2011_GWC1_48_8]KKW15351.1 MAG: Transcription elongation factor GreA [Candidatus Jorgensenbacteria bacterium GW2011_GWB1_50_10]